MKTTYSSGPLLFSVNSQRTPGKIIIKVVKIECFEYDDDGDFDNKSFKLLDHNEPNFKELIKLAKDVE